MPTPEELARQQIDALLTQCGWLIQDYKKLDLFIATGLEQWSERDERHARSSSEGSGERVGRRANESFAEAQPRALIQMATGAGKTLTACAFTYRLIKHAGARNGASGNGAAGQRATWMGKPARASCSGEMRVKRCDMDGKPGGSICGDESINVLFLVDRANLGRQAMAEWSSSDMTLSAGKARRVSAGSANGALRHRRAHARAKPENRRVRVNQFQQFVTPDGRKFTERQRSEK